MDNEYTATLPVKGKDPNNYQREVTGKITVHIAFSDLCLCRPFTQADTKEYDDDDVTYSTLTYCLIRWKNPDGTIRHVVGCTIKNPKDSEDYLSARRHAFADALHKLFPGYYVLNPTRQNKNTMPHAIDERSQHTENRATFWAWFRNNVEPEVIQEVVEADAYGKSPSEKVFSDVMLTEWLADIDKFFLRGR